MGPADRQTDRQGEVIGTCIQTDRERLLGHTYRQTDIQGEVIGTCIQTDRQGEVIGTCIQTDRQTGRGYWDLQTDRERLFEPTYRQTDCINIIKPHPIPYWAIVLAAVGDSVSTNTQTELSSPPR